MIAPEIVKQYKDFSENTRKLAPKTVSEYVRVLESFKGFDLLKAAGPEAIDQAIIDLGTENGWEWVYIYKYQAVLRTFYQWAAYKQLTPQNLYPYSKIRKPKRKEPKFLTQSEFDFVYDAAEKSPVIAAQDRMLLRLLWDTGIRRNEASLLDIKDIDLESSVIMLPKEKTKGGNRSRICPFGPLSAKLLGEHIDFAQTVGVKEHLLLNEDLGRMSSQGVYLRIKKIALIANQAASLAPHALRHSLGIRILENGGDIGFTAKLLGHESINTSLHYLNLAKENTISQYKKYAQA